MMLQRLRLCAHFSDGTMPAHGTDGLRFAYRRAGGKATFLPPNRCDSAHNLLGLPGPDPGHFLLVQKVTKNTHRGGTLSMGSLPYVPHPHDDTKGDACPPLESPASEETCPEFLWILPQVRLKKIVSASTKRNMSLFHRARGRSTIDRPSVD